jgi:hypothetical protein
MKIEVTMGILPRNKLFKFPISMHAQRGILDRLFEKTNHLPPEKGGASNGHAKKSEMSGSSPGGGFWLCDLWLCRAFDSTATHSDPFQSSCLFHPEIRSHRSLGASPQQFHRHFFH